MLKLLRLLLWMMMSAMTALVAVGGAAYWLWRDANRPGPLVQAKAVVIAPHTGLRAVAELLGRDGVVRHPLTFAAIAELSGRGHALRAGEYEFPAGASAVAALDIIAAGRSVRHKLTIPEGLTSPEIVALVNAAPALTGSAGPVPPEGALFPDTYLYSRGEGRAALLHRMQSEMTRVVGELWRQRFPDLPLATPADAVTLASVVEKETAVPAERAHIAGVYINRLRRGMPLDADPTVLFALEDDGTTKLGRPLAHADLAVDSPYNTYRIKGLPPGPIDNPGRASLRAAMQPEPTDDLYFVADGKGGHVFSKTLAGQTRHIAQYLKTARPVAAPAPDPRPPPAAPPPPPPEKPDRTHSGSSAPPPAFAPRRHHARARPAVLRRHHRPPVRRVARAAHRRPCRAADRQRCRSPRR